MTDFEILVVLVVVAVLYALKRFVFDKIFYRLTVSPDFPVATSNLDRLFLELGVWRKYYSPIRILCTLGPILGALTTLIFWPSSQNSIESQNFYFLMGIAWLIIPMWLWRKHVTGLKFSSIITYKQDNEVFDDVMAIASENNWQIIDSQRGKFIQAESTFSGLSWGELITVVITENQLLFNSIASPYKKTSLVTLGRNSANKKKIEAAIRN